MGKKIFLGFSFLCLCICIYWTYDTFVIYKDIIRYGTRNSYSCPNPFLVIWDYPRRIFNPPYYNSITTKVRQGTIYRTCTQKLGTYTGDFFVFSDIDTDKVLTALPVYSDPQYFYKAGGYGCKNTFFDRTGALMLSYKLIDYSFFMNNYVTLSTMIGGGLLYNGPLYITDGTSVYIGQYEIKQQGTGFFPLLYGWAIDSDVVYFFGYPLKGIDSKSLKIINQFSFQTNSGTFFISTKVVGEEPIIEKIDDYDC